MKMIVIVSDAFFNVRKENFDFYIDEMQRLAQDHNLVLRRKYYFSSEISVLTENESAAKGTGDCLNLVRHKIAPITPLFFLRVAGH